MDLPADHSTARIDPSTIGEFPCTLCGHVSLAWFLLLEHRRRGCKQAGDRVEDVNFRTGSYLTRPENDFLVVGFTGSDTEQGDTV